MTKKNGFTSSTHWMVGHDNDGRVVILLGDGDTPVIANPANARRIEMSADEARELAAALRKAVGAL